MNIAYIGIDLLYPALEALGKIGCNIVEIFTCETDNVTEFNQQICAYACERNIPLTVGRIEHADYERLRQKGCDMVICAGYYYRVPMAEGMRMVNIHPSLLPVGRGAWPMPVTILKGLTESGVTVHKMTEKFDDGDILLQESAAVSPDENLQTLLKKQQALLPEMMKRLAEDTELLYRNAVPQGKGEYWECPDEAAYPLNREMRADEADRILRAFYGYECVYEGEDGRYGLLFGEISHVNGNFPVQGGFIKAKKVRKL